MHGTAIKVSVIYPGWIESENAGAKQPLMVSTEKGVAALVHAIEKEKASACVRPPWHRCPWSSGTPRSPFRRFM